MSTPIRRVSPMDDYYASVTRDRSRNGRFLSMVASAPEIALTETEQSAQGFTLPARDPERRTSRREFDLYAAAANGGEPVIDLFDELRTLSDAGPGSQNSAPPS